MEGRSPSKGVCKVGKKDALIEVDKYILKKYCENPGIELQLVRLQGSEYILPDQEGGDQK